MGIRRKYYTVHVYYYSAHAHAIASLDMVVESDPLAMGLKDHQ